MVTPGAHFHYDFGDPSINLGTPQYNLIFIVELEESAIRSTELMIGEVSG